jgi:hypothetical protein
VLGKFSGVIATYQKADRRPRTRKLARSPRTIETLAVASPEPHQKSLLTRAFRFQKQTYRVPTPLTVVTCPFGPKSPSQLFPGIRERIGADARPKGLVPL